MRNETVPASYLILIRDNKTLLLKRANTGYEDGNYSLIAGHVEQGESFSTCLIREAEEEAGIILQSDDLEVLHIMHRDSGQDKQNQRIDVFFTACKWTGEIRNMEPHKCDDLSWFDLNAIPENTISYIRKVLENLKTAGFYSEYGWEK